MPKKKEVDLVITTIRAPRDLWADVRTQAYKEKLSAGAFVLKVLQAYLEKVKD